MPLLLACLLMTWLVRISLSFHGSQIFNAQKSNSSFFINYMYFLFPQKKADLTQGGWMGAFGIGMSSHDEAHMYILIFSWVLCSKKKSQLFNAQKLNSSVFINYVYRTSFFLKRKLIPHLL